MLPKIDEGAGASRARTEGDLLVVETGAVRRTWRLTSGGLVTVGFADLISGREWAGPTPAACDWSPPGAGDAASAELESLAAAPADDGGFTSEHLRVEARLKYPQERLAVRLAIWAYPGAPGIRTQLHATALDGYEPRPGPRPQGGEAEAAVERLPIAFGACRRRVFGYYNDTQNRNDTHLDILKEHVVAHPMCACERYEWPSVLCVEDDAGGVALVKESHKCVNQRGHATGGFACDEVGGVTCTGWGMTAGEITPGRFRPAWATWSLAWSGGDAGRERAFKTFDALRYPIDRARDVYIQANTWGSTADSRDARRAACEENVLRELDSCADLGIDCLQIDDGWQAPPGSDSWRPDAGRGWKPHPESYPEGWKRVRERARRLGVRLGLWAPAQEIPLEDLVWNFERGGFVQYKLDFASLRSRDEIDALMEKVRAFVARTGHEVRVNWDVTENAPRYGYFFAREFGCIYLENRKPVRPPGAVYRPHTVLRDLWQVARYLNLHRFQCSIQNVDRVDRARSDAHLHSHSYAVAIGLMGIPLFFQETRLYSGGARDEIRPVLAAYGRHRRDMFRGIVYPIGGKPDNAGWTGFQCHIAEEGRGYLTVFRERCSPDRAAGMELRFLAGKRITIRDLLGDGSAGGGAVEVGADGRVMFELDDAPAFLFARYDPA